MALAITAPVKVANAGESDPALYPISNVGAPLADIVGTTDTSGGNVTVTISGANGTPVSFTFAAVLFAFTTAGKLSYTPTAPGLYTVTVKDVTSGNTVSTTIQVFGSEGV